MSKLIFRFLALFLLAGLCLSAADKKPITDDAIYDNVINKLASDPIAKGGAFKVEVKDGVVTLSGPVANERQKDKATQITKKVKGVKSVVNSLVIQDRPTGKSAAPSESVRPRSSRFSLFRPSGGSSSLNSACSFWAKDIPSRKAQPGRRTVTWFSAIPPRIVF